MSDRNYVSLAGNASGELYITDLRKGPEPILLRQAGDLTPLVLHLGDILTPEGYTDALKLSGAYYVTVFVGELLGASEDCIDINHSGVVDVHIQRTTPRGKYVATIKASYDVTLTVVEQHGHGSETDFDLGNWSDQSRMKTSKVTLFSRTTDGSAAKVRRLNAEKPTLHSDCRWKLTYWPCFLPLMRVLKALHLA